MTNEQRERIAGTLIVKEPEEKEPYAVEDSKIVFDVDYVHNEETSAIDTKISGAIVSSVYIDNTELEFVKSWRFEVYGLKILGISVDTKENQIIHRFEADRFEILDDLGDDDGEK